MVQAGWNDVCHLDEVTKAEMLESTPLHMRAARSTGEPSLGSGAIYPVDPSVFVVDPFAIPAHFAKGYGFDPGWNTTAALWGAHDRDNDVVYFYSEHYRGLAETSIHADAIKARGKWLVGAADWAGRDIEGQRILEVYRALDLNLVPADKTVEAGILEVWQMLSGGRIKVFSTLTNWLNEHRNYHRDENGKIVKERDHLMDCMRYLIRLRGQVMRCAPVTNRNHAGDFRVADALGGY